MSSEYPKWEEAAKDRRWLNVVNTVSVAAELRRDSEGEHNQRVGYYAALIARKLAIPEKEIEIIRQAAQLHDLGTIFIPENILLKKGKLLPGEFEVVKSHIGMGLNLLGNSQSPVIKMARLIIETHHEAWDGSGYPLGLRGLKIPLVGQIVAVADAFDTLINDQPYRKAWTVSDAVNEIQTQSGKKYSPQVVKAFMDVINDKSYLAEIKPVKKREVLLRGKLGSMSLFDLLNLLAQNKDSGILSLYMGVSVYEIIIYEGEIINAIFEKKRGEEALVRIAAKSGFVSKVKFVMTAWQGEPPALESIYIKKPANQLLFDVAVKIDHDTEKMRKIVY